MAATGSDLGGVGLIETRNARFRPDGTLEAGLSARRQRRFAFLNFQALPFLETTFRFTERLNATTGAGFTTDRAFDLKLRLLRESDWLPQVAVGLQDLIGTGIYAGEYAVASKRLGAFDLSLGVGWGRLGTGGDVSNPLGLASDRVLVRPRQVGRGGSVEALGFFRGPEAALFGGVEWSVPSLPTPWGAVEGMRAKLEWSGDALRDERGGYPARTTGLRGEARTRLNLGLQWQPTDWLDAGVHFLHGTDLLLRLSLRLDPADPPRLPAAPPPRLAPRPAGWPAPAAETAADAEPRPGAGPVPGTAPGLGGGAGLGGASLGALTPGPALPSVAPAPAPARTRPRLPPRVEPGRPVAGRTARAAGATSPPSVGATRRGAAALPARPAARAGRGAVPARPVPAAPPFPLPPAAPDAAPDGAEAPDALAAAAFPALRRAGFQPLALAVEGIEARVAVAGGPHRTLALTAGRVLRALQPHLPPVVETVLLSWWRDGAEVARLRLLRASLEAAAAGRGSAEEILAGAQLLAPDGTLPEGAAAAPGPRYTWGVAPLLRLSLGDPSAAARWQALVAAGGRLELGGGVAVAGSVARAVAGNLGGAPESDSRLPRVRSDFGRYAREGRTPIPALYLERLWNPAPDVLARATAGYLEPMFAGVSGEVLWRPHGRPWGVGLDLAYVAQRDYDQHLGLRPYRVATGHLSLHADLPVWNLYGVLRAGRYLAGDWGGTVELGRRFDSGIEVGGFATFTNVPFSVFGEGSFDKGIYVRVPLDLFGTATRGVGGVLLRPVTRDGGQRLGIDSPLWEVGRDGRADALRRGAADFAR